MRDWHTVLIIYDRKSLEDNTPGISFSLWCSGSSQFSESCTLLDSKSNQHMKIQGSIIFPLNKYFHGIPSKSGCHCMRGKKNPQDSIVSDCRWSSQNYTHALDCSIYIGMTRGICWRFVWSQRDRRFCTTQLEWCSHSNLSKWEQRRREAELSITWYSAFF